MAAPTKTALVKKVLANSEPSTHGPSRHFAATQQIGRFRSEADIKPDFMSTRPSTTLADLFKLHVRTDPFSAVRASLRRQSSDERDDGVTDGRQAWLRRRSVDSFFPISLF
jgi:hypothetical protein